jgi:predicted AAA+ superfamily ATPase
MERLLMQDLTAWKNNPQKKPLVLQGVRQCGETWLITQFAKRYYTDFVYYRFDKDAKIKDFFEQDLDPLRIIKDLGLARGKSINPEETLIIFDEIQECGRAVTALKYFYEDAPEYGIISAGSLLGVAMKKGTSFPVGKVEFLTLYPLSFFEFLYAQNQLLAEELHKSFFRTVSGKISAKNYLKNIEILMSAAVCLKQYKYGSIPKGLRRYKKNRMKYCLAIKRTSLNMPLPENIQKYQQFGILSPVNSVRKIANLYSARLIKAGVPEIWNMRWAG